MKRVVLIQFSLDFLGHSIKDNPPSKDGLSVEDCERIIVALILENVFSPHIVWSAYDSIVYLRVGDKGQRLLGSPQPKIIIRFPKKDTIASGKALKETAQKAKKVISDDDGWLEAKSKGTKRKAAAAKATKKVKKAATRKKTKAPAKAKKPSAKASKKSLASEVIELLSDDDSVAGPDAKPSASAENDALWEDGTESGGSGSEFEFE